MKSYAQQGVRVEIQSSRYEAGQLLVTVRGRRGEFFADLPWTEPHGFHSRPHSGSTGYLHIPGDRSDMAFVSAAQDFSKVPELKPGEAAMYDNTGNVVTLGEAGWDFNFDVVIRARLRVEGDIECGGTIHCAGDGLFKGSVIDGDGDGGA